MKLGAPELKKAHPLKKAADKICKPSIRNGEYRFCAYLDPSENHGKLRGESLLKKNENFMWVSVKLKNLSDNSTLSCRDFAASGLTADPNHCNRFNSNVGTQPGYDIRYVMHWVHRRSAKKSVIKRKKGQFYAAKQCGA